MAEPSEMMELARTGQNLVQGLTKSSSGTFLCFQVFNELYSSSKKDCPKSVKQTFKIFRAQSYVYASTIKLSLRIAQCGISLCRDARMQLADDEAFRREVAPLLLSQASDAHNSANRIAQDFRGIRQELYRAAQTFLGSDFDALTTQTNDIMTSSQVLRRMSRDEIIALMPTMVHGLAETAGRFVDWWNSIQVNLIRVIGYIRNRSRLPCISVWYDLEVQYTEYDREVRKQEDFYQLQPSKPGIMALFRLR